MHGYFHSLLRGEKQGLGPALQRAGLWALSQPYGLAVRGRNWLFERGWKKSFRVNVPVVSVGNLTVGGTGKTPCVEYVARFFLGLNLRVAILSRGYGAQRAPRVSGGSERAARVSGGSANDEALLLAQNLPGVPHLQGADRVTLAMRSIAEHGTEVLVLDDGFQHRRLERDLDLVLIDATCPWGHDYLLPRGLLREPAAGLKRASLVMLTRCDQVRPEVLAEIHERIGRIAPELPVVETTHRPGGWINAAGATLPLSACRDRPWAGFCGIGNPEAFRQTLLDLRRSCADFSPSLCDWRTFADHHNYGPDDLAELNRWAGKQPTNCVIVTTQKDLVKIPMEKLNDRPQWALQIELHVRTQARLLEEKLLAVLPPAPSSPSQALPFSPSQALPGTELPERLCLSN